MIADTSDAEWQLARNGLIITACVVSIFICLFAMISIRVIFVQHKPQPVSLPELSIKNDFIEVAWTNSRHLMDMVLHYNIKHNTKARNTDISEKANANHNDSNSSKFSSKLRIVKPVNGKRYTVAIGAVNHSGQGNWSREANVWYKVPPKKPKQHTIEVVSLTQIDIKVNRPATNDNCKICKVEYKADTNAEWCYKKFSISQNTELKFTIDSLTPDTTYSTRIRMINDEGESEPNNSVSVTTPQLEPGPPQRLRVYRRTTTTLTIQWDKLESSQIHDGVVERYKVQYCRAGTSNWISHEVSLDTSATHYYLYEVSQLLANTTYYLQVQAVNNRGVGGKWSEVMEKTKPNVVVRGTKQKHNKCNIM